MLSPLDEISKLTAKPITVEFATAITNIQTPTKEYKPISSLESMVDKIGRKVYERQSLKKMGCAIRWFGKKDKKETSHHPKAQQLSHLSASSENSVLLNSFLVQQMLNRTVLLARNSYVEFFLKKPSLEETTVATTAPPTPPELKLMISGTPASEILDQSETAIQQMEGIVELEHELLKPQKELNIKQEFRRDFSISRILDGINIPASIVSSESDDHENQVKDTGPIKSETLIHKIARNATKTKMTMDVQAHVESYPATPIVPVKTAKMKTEPILDNESSDIGKMVEIKSDYSSFAETNWRPLRKTAARQQRDDLFFSSVAAKRPKLSKDVKKEKKDGITKHCVPVSPKKQKISTTPATETKKCCKVLKKDVTKAVEDCQCALGEENCISYSLFPNEVILNWVQCERTNCGKWFHMCCIFGHNEKYVEQKRKFYCCSRWAHENVKKARHGVFSNQLCSE